MFNRDMNRGQLTNHLPGFAACFLIISGLFLDVFPVCSAEVMSSDEKITIIAENEPFKKVMTRLGKSLGCKIIMPNLSNPVSISRVNANVETVLRELLRGYQYVIYWSRNPIDLRRIVEKIIIIADINSPNSSINIQVATHREEPPDSEGVFNLDKRIELLSNAIGTVSEFQSIQLALQDSSVDVRMAALDFLMALPDSEARQMIQLALQDSDPRIRNAAKEMQDIFQSEAASDDNHDIEIDPASVDGRIEALSNAIGTVSEFQSIQLALQDPSVDVRMAALELLGALPDSEARQMIQLALQDSDPGIRNAAKDMLGQLNAMNSAR